MNTKLVLVAIVLLSLLGLYSVYVATGASSHYLSFEAKGNTLAAEKQQLTQAALSKAKQQNAAFQTEATESDFTCHNLKYLKNFATQSKQGFILHKATLWWLEGEDKNSIADTLAAVYNVKIALHWVEAINRISTRHDNITGLINALTLMDFERLAFGYTPILRKTLSNYQLNFELLSSAKDRLTLDDLSASYSQQYPDNADMIWIQSANKAIALGFGDLAVKYLSNVTHNHWNSQLWLLYLDLDKLEQLESVEYEEIMQLLLEIGPILRSKQYDAQLIEFKLSSFALEYKDRFDIQAAESFEFNISASILQRIDALKRQFPLLETNLKPKELCALFKVDDEDESINTLKVKTILLNKQKIQEPHYQSLTHFCVTPKMDMVTTLTIFKKFLKDTGLAGLNVNKLETWQSLDWKKFHEIYNKLSQEQQSSVISRLYANVYPDSPAQFSIFEQLIEQGIYHKEANAGYLIQMMRNPKAHLLMEKMNGLSEFDEQTGIGLPMLALIAGNRELALALIQQGLPLKRDEFSPDPLQIALENLMNAQLAEKALLQYIQLMEEILAVNREVNSLHINAMAKLKQNKPDLFEKIQSYFPELYPYEPEEILIFNCPSKGNSPSNRVL